MPEALVVLLLPPAAYYVSWVIVHSKIADPIVGRWMAYWETRWIRKNTEPGSRAEFHAVETEVWNSKLAYLPSCIWCTGFWVSLFTVAVVLPFTSITIWPLWPLILLYMSALIGIIDSLTHREA
jgi:hypothetical protein